MKDSPAQPNLYWLLLRSAITAKHGLMRIADKRDLTIMQLYTLCLLDDDKAIPMNALSSMLSCDASNVTGIVDRLLAQKYIERTENPKDRRVKLITITPAGTKLCKTIFDEIEQEQPASFATLTTEERQTVARLLLKMTQPSE